MVCVAHNLAVAAARQQFRSVADMDLHHAYEAVSRVRPDAGIASGVGSYPNNLSRLARQILLVIGTTQMFEGSIRRANRFQSLTSMLPGIHFPAPGRPRFLMAGCVDVIGIANAVLYRHLAGYDLIDTSQPHSLPCSPWAAAYAALAHSVSLAGAFWTGPCFLSHL